MGTGAGRSSSQAGQSHAPPGTQSRAGIFARGQGRAGTTPGLAEREAASERAVPTHPGASPRPEVPASGQISPTRRTCRGSRGQQVAPDSPLSPQPGRTACPVAPRSPFGWPHQAGRGPGGAGRAALRLRCLRTTQGTWSARSSRAVGGAARAAGRRRGRLRRLEADATAPHFPGVCARLPLGRPRGTAPCLGAARTRRGPTPETARRTRVTRTRRRLWPSPGTRRGLARRGRTSRHDSGTRPSSSPGACVVWRAGGGGGVSCPPRGAAISPSYTAECADLLVSL